MAKPNGGTTNGKRSPPGDRESFYLHASNAVRQRMNGGYFVSLLMMEAACKPAISIATTNTASPDVNKAWQLLYHPANINMTPIIQFSSS